MRTERLRALLWRNRERVERLECHKDFYYGDKWNNKFYETKQVRPIFVEEADEIVVDYDAEGRLAGIEILDALKRFGGPQTLRQVVLEDVGLVRV